MAPTQPNPTTIAKVHIAMTQANGSRIEAAKSLGWARDQLEVFIKKCDDLREFWGRNPTIAVEQAYDRDRPSMTDPVDLGVSPREIEVSNAFLQQEDKLRRFDWEGLGVGDIKTLNLMRQFEGNGVGRGVLRMMDTMQGGMAFCFAKVARQFADVAEELEAETAKKNTATNPDEKRDENLVMLLHTRFMDLAREMQKFNKEATNAAHTRLLIADRAKKIQKAADKLRKPSWARAEPKRAEKVA